MLDLTSEAVYIAFNVICLFHIRVLFSVVSHFVFEFISVLRDCGISLLD
jgi:hypothetical protein